MSLSSVGSSPNAYSYLQSLLQQQSANAGSGSTDPIASLLQVFYPAGANTQPSTSAASTSGSTQSMPGGLPFSPGMMGQLLSMQEQWGGGMPWGGGSSSASHVQSLFAQFDTNGDGQISQSEFESAFGPNADMSKVDGLFNALDTNGDGSVSLNELTSAAQQSHSHHHHHGGGSGEGGLLNQLMSATQGATTQTVANSDGSSTTTISYADGSKVTLTTPAASAAPGSSNGGSASGQSPRNNAIENLIRMQAQLLTPLTPTPASASV